VFELISAVRYFARRRVGYRFRYFFNSDAALAIGFARLALSGCDIDLIVNGFLTLRIIEWLV